ncbi:MAG TPA: hypothetical protein VFS34_17510 [Thermoanaerobaculia bacterium]|nr:hypothetical protein [Thermoanaerobaculia bacterium]
MRSTRIAPLLLSVLLAGLARASADEPTSDRRVHVRAGAITESDPIVLTPDGAKVAFTRSFSIPDSRFVPDPYEEKCTRKAVRYTLKAAAQKEILGADHPLPDPDSEDALVLHPSELRNAAGKFGANAVYLLLSDSESLAGQKGVHDCAIVEKDGDRERGESLQEIGCRTEQGAKLSFSRYAGQARFYACPAPTAK